MSKIKKRQMKTEKCNLKIAKFDQKYFNTKDQKLLEIEKQNVL